MQRSRPARPHRTRVLCALTALTTAALALTGCGTRLSDARIAADARVPVSVGPGGLVPAAGGGAVAPAGQGGDPLTTGGGALAGGGTGGGTTGGGTTGGGTTSGGGGTRGGTTGGGTAGGGTTGGGTTGGGTTGGGTTGGGTTGGGGTTNGGARPAQANLSPVTIGNIGTYSGLIGAVFANAQQGVKVAVQWVNAHGGLNGHPINLVSADDGGDPATNQTLAQTMVQKNKAIAFVGNWTPVSSSGSVKFLAQNSIPVVGGDLYDPLWYSNPLYFPQGTPFVAGALAFGTMTKKLGFTKIAIAYCVESPICSNVGKAIQDNPPAGVKIVYQTGVSLAQPSFTAQCVAAKNAGAETFLISADSSGVSRATQNCVAQGFKPTFMEAAVSVSPDQTKLSANEGMTAILQDFPWFQESTPATKEFHDAFRQYAPSIKLNQTAATSWTAVQLLQLGSGKLAASNPTPQQLVNGLYALGSTDLRGLSPSKITYRAGKPATGTSCFHAARIIKGQWVSASSFQPICN